MSVVLWIECSRNTRAVCVLNELSCPPLDLVYRVDECPLYYDPISSITHIMLSAALTPQKTFARISLVTPYYAVP